jgi:hypothetical protein
MRIVWLAAVVLLLVAVPSGPSAVARPCAPVVERGVLPVWARTGFSDARPRIAHAVGRAGRIAAILFADPLHAPPLEGRNNKILWVARTPLTSPGDLRISAQRMAGARRIGEPVARRVEGGPGPSIVDLPAAGCWRLTVRWGSRRDELDLRYVSPRQG